MSYLALARKWRPHQFNQVVGQAHVLTALENALIQNKLHHAYLFSGTRGVGKTTIGRLFAKGLNCETGITSTPCGECDTCREIDQGRFVDLLEIDAASRTKVEDTRELLDNVQYKPARGRFKVYLIDEVHMLSRHSFNALLKTLEEPPEYVKFLLATTDPQKLPVTILSRCLQFHLKPISVDNIHQQLNFILEHENVTAEARALGMISYAADGSMRDALSLTDQAIALGNGTVDTDTVSTMLGTIDTDQAIYLLEAISSKQAQVAMSVVQELAANGAEWDSLLQELASQLHRIAMCQALPASLDKSKPDAERIAQLTQHLSPQDVQLYYQIALKGRQDLAYAPCERMGVEMAVLRMIAFRPAKSVTATSIDTTLPETKLPNRQQPEIKQPENTQATGVAKTVEKIEPTVTPEARPTASAEMVSPSIPVTSSIPVTNPVTVTEEAQPVLRPAPTVEQPPVESHRVAHQEQPPMPSEDDYPAEMEEYEPMSYSMQDNNDYPLTQPEMTQASQPMVEPAAPVQQAASQVPQSTAPARVGLRHQLRSKRASSNPTNSERNQVKKSKSVSPDNVLDRVAQQHGVAAKAMPISSTEEKSNTDNEPYQWKPSKIVVEKESGELTPTQVKQALEHAKTPEMMEKLRVESVSSNPWAALIQSLDTAKLVEQLALNSYYEKHGSTIQLFLRPSQAHLNTDKAQRELLQALNQALGEHCYLRVEISDKGETPLELREALYQQKLQSAFSTLENDANVQFIQARFAASLDRESVRPI